VSQTILLDTGVLGLVTNPQRSPQAIQCLRWVEELVRAEVQVFVPEIADYELRRERLLAQRLRGLARLEALSGWLDYLPLTTKAMHEAARCWARARQQGQPTADDRTIDGDMILVGQALALDLPVAEIMVATTNVRHLVRFVPADLWQNIRPE
jgi:predicted nucleic acid-binding protein